MIRNVLFNYIWFGRRESKRFGRRESKYCTL